MSSKSRTGFTAGGAGLTSNKVNVNLNSAGGGKKQGIASRVALGYRSNFRAVNEHLPQFIWILLLQAF